VTTLVEARLRETVVRGLQEALTKAGAVVGVKLELRVDAHITVGEIESAIERVQTGPGVGTSLWEVERPVVL
jgi:hypothetical protein